MITEQHIKMAAKMYRCRDAAKGLFKEEFSERVKPYKQLLRAVMIKNNIGELPALLEIAKTEAYLHDGMTQMLFMAATVELIEPSEK